MIQKKRVSILRIVLLSLGFFGIQGGFSIQFARVTPIFEKLGALANEIPWYWLAAPLTGFIVQPVVGYMSDRTWGALGRRRPYILFGTILSVLALFIMPNTTFLWTAVLNFWLLSFAIDFCMQPFRAFVADILPEEQVATGYSIQTILIGIGGGVGFWVAARDWLEIFPSLSIVASSSLQLQFYITGIIFLATIIITVISTKEYPPEDMEAFLKMKGKSKGIGAEFKSFFRELFVSLKEMPPLMRKLSGVQFFTWLGFFCMWMFYSVSVAKYIFGAAEIGSELYEKGVSFASDTMVAYQVVATAFAFLMPYLVKKITAVGVHTFGLVAAGIGLLSIYFISDPFYLYIAMIGVGFAWATTLAMPYTILVSLIPPQKYGIYMGIFNFFIVIPQILAALTLGRIMKTFLGNNEMAVVLLGGVFMFVAAVVLQSLRRYNKRVAAAEL
ncbi:MAG: Major Facilitator Superfamily protein [bacterium ADurb.Bin270]|nr:SLC45 family MFS transporter [Myxococcales bacterium]OQA59171.1 MAG: Major Facilitator Superfamily protein [bacterium ADurb.Bin270]HQH80792.1 MFS transporter [bacterium]